VKEFILKVSAPIRKHLYIYLASFVILSILVSTSLILKFESAYLNSPIKTVNDAIWWSAVGISTIGIANIIPASPAGKYLTLFLMLVGVVILSVLTAKIPLFLRKPRLGKIWTGI